MLGDVVAEHRAVAEPGPRAAAQLAGGEGAARGRAGGVPDADRGLRHGAQSTNSSSSPSPDHDLALLLELADRPDDGLLGLLDLGAGGRGRAARSPRAGSPRRARTGSLVILSRTSSGDALEGEGELGAVDLAQHLLDVAVLEVDDVLEHEHPAADLLGQRGVERLQALDDLALGGAVGAVDDVDQRVEAADARRSRWAGASRRAGARGCASTARTISGEVAVHDRDPVRDLGLLLRGEAGEQQRGLLGRSCGRAPAR